MLLLKMAHHHHSTQRGLTLAFWLNMSFSVVEAIGGLATNSAAILADAFHDFMDALAIGMAVWLGSFALRKRSSTHFSYGYRRFSLLSAIALSIFLLAGAVLMIINAVRSLLHPQVINSTGMLWLALLGLAVNGFAFLRLRKASHDHHGPDHNRKAISLHLLEDVLGWVAVLAGAAIIHFTRWYWIDPLLAIGIAAFIGYNGAINLSSTMRILLQGTPREVNTEELLNELEAVEGVRSIHDLHVWSLDGSYNIGSLHVVVSEHFTASSAAIHNHVARIMAKYHVEHATIQIENETDNCPLKGC